MRLLLSSDVSARGGVDGYVLDLARALRAAGHEPVLAVEEATTSPLRDAAEAVSGLQVHLVPMYHRRYPREHLDRAARALLAEVKPDGLHTVCGSPRSCLVLREVAVEHGLPIAITEQQIRDDLSLPADDVERIRGTYRAARAVAFVSEGNRSSMAAAVVLSGFKFDSKKSPPIMNELVVSVRKVHPRTVKVPYLSVRNVASIGAPGFSCASTVVILLTSRRAVVIVNPPGSEGVAVSDRTDTVG